MEKEAVSQQSDGKIGSGKRLERDKLDRVEKGKKVLHGKVEFHVLKMKEEVKQLKSLSYKNKESFFGAPQMLVSCPIRLIITQTQKKYCTTMLTLCWALSSLQSQVVQNHMTEKTKMINCVALWKSVSALLWC